MEVNSGIKSLTLGIRNFFPIINFSPLGKLVVNVEGGELGCRKRDTVWVCDRCGRKGLRTARVHGSIIPLFLFPLFVWPFHSSNKNNIFMHNFLAGASFPIIDSTRNNSTMLMSRQRKMQKCIHCINHHNNQYYIDLHQTHTD